MSDDFKTLSDAEVGELLEGCTKLSGPPYATLTRALRTIQHERVENEKLHQELYIAAERFEALRTRLSRGELTEEMFARCRKQIMEALK